MSTEMTAGCFVTANCIYYNRTELQSLADFPTALRQHPFCQDGKTVRRTTTTTTRVVKASDLRSDGDAPKPATVIADQKPTKKKSSCLSMLFQVMNRLVCTSVSPSVFPIFFAICSQSFFSLTVVKVEPEC